MKTYSIILLFLFCISLNAQDALKPGEHLADINGVKINYHVAGKGPVCLLPTPGWGVSMFYLKNSLKPFEKYFTMVYYDTRGSGKSTAPADPMHYSDDFYMKDLDGLRAHLKQEKVWLMGHSMGGYQVLNYTLENEKNVNGIVAIAPMAGRDEIYREEFVKLIYKREKEPYFNEGFAVFSREDTVNVKLTQFMPKIFPFYFHDANNIQKFAALADYQPMESFISDDVWDNTGIAEFGNKNLFPELSKIKVPTLVIVGDDDFITDQKTQAGRIVEKIPNSKMILVKNAGHFAWIEQPDYFFNEAQKWLVEKGLKENE